MNDVTRHRDSSQTRAAFLERAGQLHSGWTLTWDVAGSGAPLVVGSPGLAFGVARSAHERGPTAWLVASSRSTERAAALLEVYERDPSGFRPPRETLGSFLIVDPARERVCMGRDRTAVYHVYAAQRDGVLYASTHPEPFLGTVCQAFDPVGLDLLLAYGIAIAPFPIYEGLHAVMPGQWLDLDRADLGGPVELGWGKVFWQIERVEVGGDYDAAVQRYGDLFLANVEDNLQGSAAGVYLSGGSDSACVMGALAALGVDQVVAAHMQVEGHMDAEMGLVEALRRAYGFELELVYPKAWDGDWMAWVRESITHDMTGCYHSFPAFRLLARRLVERVPAGTTIFNGEMCLLDQGFSDASDRWRGLKRWLYRGGGRRLAQLGPVVPSAVRELSGRIGKRTSMAAAMTESALELLHALGRPEFFFAGMKVGGRKFPGAPRSIYRFAQAGGAQDTPSAVVSGFFEHYSDALLTDAWPQVVATMANSWYSEASNFTAPLRALGSPDVSMCFPFSSVGLMDFAASLPTEWAVDKRVQKDMSARVLGMPDDVAFFMKDHGAATRYTDLMFSKAQQAEMLAAVRGHDYGGFQPGVDRRLRQLAVGDRQFSLVEYMLFGLSIYAQALGGGESSRAAAPAA